jgi:hypothetical protein
VRVEGVEPKFVDFIPDDLEHGVIYVSIPYGAVVHACCCGCGEKVSTPLSPAQWSLTYDGERISLSPSVGSGALPCNSHYVIRRNRVRWAVPLTTAQTAAALQRDRAVIAEHYEPPPTDTQKRSRWWMRVAGWFRP